MAQLNFGNMQENNNTFNNSVGFFSLKNDGDSAVVRFMYDDIASLEASSFSVHDVVVNQKHRKVSCLREPEEPFNKCPLCASGNAAKQKFFIHLVQYVLNPTTGQIEAQPKIWERSVSYAFKLRDFLNEYGPLSQVLFKITRKGAAGSTDTDYNIMFLYNPEVYNEVNYPILLDAFKDHKILGGLVMQKTFDEVNTFITTGEFPATAPQTPNNIPTTQATAPQPVPNAIPTGVVSQPTPATQSYYQPAYTAPAPVDTVQPAVAPAPTPTPVAPTPYETPVAQTPHQAAPVYNSQPAYGGQPAIQRPVRSYN